MFAHVFALSPRPATLFYYHNTVRAQPGCVYLLDEAPPSVCERHEGKATTFRALRWAITAAPNMATNRSMRGLPYAAASMEKEPIFTVGEIDAAPGHQTFKTVLRQVARRVRGKAANAKVVGTRTKRTKRDRF